MKAHNTDAEFSGQNVSRTNDFETDEAEWDADQFVQSTGNECVRSGCEYHTTDEDNLFCNFCWENRVLPELDMSAFTAQAEGLAELDDIEQIPVEIEVED